MNYLFKYIKEHIYTIIVFFVFCGIFLLSVILFHLPIKAVIYPALFCLLLILIIFSVDYYKSYKKHKTLEDSAKLPENLLSALSQYQKVYDGDYQKIIENLLDRESRTKSENLKSQDAAVDYYTTWVHQIKTPLSAIKLTLQNYDNELSRSIADDIFKIEQYVEMVLTYQRLNSMSTDYVFREYELDKIIKNCVKKFAGQFINKGLSLSYNGTDKIVTTDSKWLSFVIEQLISNSVKYTNKGRIEITVTDSSDLIISDTGIGISESDLPLIFKKGYTGFNGRNEKHSSGLGLYLCRRICDNLGVDISVESTPDKGTAVTLPLGKKSSIYE